MEPKIETKAWNHEIEKAILKRWEDEGTYRFEVNEKPAFVIDTPPPYPSGKPWHIGAAAHYAQIDMIARTARMSGKNVLFPIGIDRNGLPVEIYTEKKYKVRMRQMDRQKFLDLCKGALDDLEAEMLAIMKSMGLSGDFAHYYRTDSDEYRALTQATFIELWKRGLVYLANRPNNYCPDCGTTIADAEIIHDDLPTKLVHMKFKVAGKDDSITIASTRPELLCACQAVIVNPEDERYLDYQNKTVVLPLYGREVPVKTHHSARPEFGSGAVMVCSYGDQNDVQVFRELGLKEIVALNENGITTEVAGPYAGLRVNQARAKVIEDLKAANLLEKEESIMHRTPLCERSKTPIEIIPLHDYYVKQMDYVPQLRELAMKLQFHPEMHRQILLNWLDSVAIDWPVSRRRFYGTEIPIWYCDSCKAPLLPEPGKYYRPWKESPPFEKCAKCGHAGFTGEVRTFDTWMDSSISPLFVTKFGRDGKLFDYAYPAALRPQAKDIIRTWLHYTMLRCVQLTEKMPWTDAWIMGYGVDEKGEKMSKSKGNVIDPFPVIQQHGADTFRFWSASEANLGYDFRCSEQRIAGSQKFLSKLWNVGRFLSSFEIETKRPAQLEASDKWILAELAQLVQECRRGYDGYNFFVPANAIRDFTWNVFAAHYIEMVKARAYEDRPGHASALYTLHKVFSTILVLLAPLTPFISEELWTKMYSDKSIHHQQLPEVKEDAESAKYTKAISDFNSLVWNKKKETISKETGKPLSLKDPLEIAVPDELAPFASDLTTMHNLIRK
ncbi:valine--tRNA ligase [Candidatus Nitrososphaera sp. FF02]|uniref:valine--tRNA ligase n=1 Tax=Candidatus Nitrososphaera sp. FF02 TaxID=3398226 RepID=UPI0039E9EA82